MSLEWIGDDRISLVFQGPVGDPVLLAARLALARASMPAAEIIVSTWAGTATDAAWPVDHVVASADPGSIYVDPVMGNPNNLLRQAVSTAAGVAVARRPFVAKVRTDFGFSAAALPLGPPLAASAALSVFARPVTIAVAGTRDPYTSGMPFHPSDFFTFGTRDDIAQLWAFVREPLSLARPFISSWERLRVWRYGAVTGRYVPEQELALSLLRRTGHADLADRVRHMFAADPEILAAALAFLQHNYRAFAGTALGLLPPARLVANAVIDRGNVDADAEGMIRRAPHDDYAVMRRRAGQQAAAVAVGALFGPHGARAAYFLGLRARAALRTHAA